MQNERCPRISANDVIRLKNEKPHEIAVIDLRSHLEFNRAHLKGSINIPFASISLSEVKLEALNIPDLEARLNNQIAVVVASNSHENAILVMNFNTFLNVVQIYMKSILISVCSLFNGLWHEKSMHST